VAVADANITLPRSLEWVVVFREIAFLEIRWLRKNLPVQIYGLDTCIFCTQYCQHGVRVYFASRVYESFFSPTLFYQSSFFGFQMFSSSRGSSILRWFFNKVPLPASYSARLPYFTPHPYSCACANNAQHCSCSAKITPTPYSS
jgi:hypothetical protein